MDWPLHPEEGQKEYGKVVEERIDQMRDHNKKKQTLFYFIAMTGLKN